MLFAGHCLFSSQGNAKLTNPMGPQFTPAPAQRQAKFAVLGDCHAHRKSLQGFLQQAAAQQNDFGIQLGDFVDYDEDLAYHHFVNRLGRPPFPLFLVRGNHEAVNFKLNESRRYLTYIKESDYSFVHANTLFVVLDSSHAYFQVGQIERATAAAAEFRAANAAGKIIVLTHFPPSSAGATDAPLSSPASKELLAFCEENAVDFLITGHVHTHSESTEGTTRLIVDGCGGGSLPDPSTAVHYLQFTINDGEISFAKVPLPRDARVVALMDYFLFVAVLRYRWIALAIACVILVREGFGLAKVRRQPKDDEAPADSDDEAPPAEEA